MVSRLTKFCIVLFSFLVDQLSLSTFFIIICNSSTRLVIVLPCIYHQLISPPFQTPGSLIPIPICSCTGTMCTARMPLSFGLLDSSDPDSGCVRSSFDVERGCTKSKDSWTRGELEGFRRQSLCSYLRITLARFSTSNSFESP